MLASRLWFAGGRIVTCPPEAFLIHVKSLRVGFQYSSSSFWQARPCDGALKLLKRTARFSRSLVPSDEWRSDVVVIGIAREPACGGASSKGVEDLSLSRPASRRLPLKLFDEAFCCRLPGMNNANQTSLSPATSGIARLVNSCGRLSN